MLNGKATVLAAVNTQAKIVTKVAVVPETLPPLSPHKSLPVTFDRVADTDSLSLTAGALGAVSVHLSGLLLEQAVVQDYTLVSSGAGSDVRFVLHLEILKTAAVAATGTASRDHHSTGPVMQPNAASLVSTAPSQAVNPVAPATRVRPAVAPAPEPVIETVVLRAPSPPAIQPSAASLVPPPVASDAEKSAHNNSSQTSSVVDPSSSRNEDKSAAPAITPVVHPDPMSVPLHTSAGEKPLPASSGAGALEAAADPPMPDYSSSPPLPCRLVDYFAVMVSQEVEFDPAVDGPSGSNVGAGDAASRRRRTGNIQYRYPKRNHADCPLPENVDWFAFPNGIAPMLQPTSAQSRPPIQNSVFVLSNVDGGTLGGRMYGCCLTAYRKEVEDSIASSGADDERDAGDGTAEASGVTVRTIPLVASMVLLTPTPMLCSFLCRLGGRLCCSS